MDHNSYQNFGKERKIPRKSKLQKAPLMPLLLLVLAFSLDVNYFGYYDNKGICGEGLRKLRRVLL